MSEENKDADGATGPGAEKNDAAAAAKPGAAAAGITPTAAAQENNAQNVPAGPAGRTPLQVVDVHRGMFGVQDAGDTSGYGGLVRTVALPPPSSRPYGSWFDDVVDVLEDILRERGLAPEQVLQQVVVDRGELTLYIAREHLRVVAQAMRDDQDLRFELCLGVSGVHWPHQTGHELHAVYHLFSVTHLRQIRLEVTCPDEDAHVPSIVDIYPGNDWHEREAFDFFGIVFDGHPHLARSHMPDDWVGHPQRKDYPLGGIPVEYKGATVPPPESRRAYNS